jgi:hypothetical protein
MIDDGGPRADPKKRESSKTLLFFVACNKDPLLAKFKGTTSLE